MKTTAINNHLRDLFALALGICMIVVILLIMNRDYPLVGHDYAYFIPRLLDSGLHIRINGLSVQWYTPSFGGGLPAFPNPQHMQYSFVQLLTLYMNPWSAILVSTALISLAGYLSFYKFLNKHLELNWMSSILGAMFFIGNGFHIEHLIAGQMGYQLFPLGAVILNALVSRDVVHNTVIIAGVTALMVFQAGFYLIVILALSFAMTVPVLHLYKPGLLDKKIIAATAIFAMILAGCITASKLYATMSFMVHFPRHFFDVYPVDLFQASIGLIAQFLGVMVLEPILILSRQKPEFLSGALANLTGARYGIWETDISLSPVLIFFLFYALANIIKQLRQGTRIRVDRSILIPLILLGAVIWVTLEMTFAKGLIYTTTKQLPVLKSLHVNVRFASAFILPLVILGVIQVERFFLQTPKLSNFLALAFLTVASLLSYFSLAADVHTREFDVSKSNSIHEKIKHESTFPVTHIAEISTWTGFQESASSIRPYEPIFGYRLEEFTPHIRPGSVFETDNGYFNMTNPSSLVFPEINNTHPFERVRVSEKDKLEAFVQRRQPEWKIPVTQKILNTLSLIALIFTFGVFLIAIVDRMNKAVTNRNVT
jgi:hypothetical protein